MVKVNPQKLKAREQAVFADFATVLSLVPDLIAGYRVRKGRCGRLFQPRLAGQSSVTSTCCCNTSVYAAPSSNSDHRQDSQISPPKKYRNVLLNLPHEAMVVYWFL